MALAGENADGMNSKIGKKCLAPKPVTFSATLDAVHSHA
jgi:hypothetical protein